MFYYVFAAGYSYPVDWWSLGIVAYEMRAGGRPFIVHSCTPLTEVKNILNTAVHYPRYWSSNFVDLLSRVSILFFYVLSPATSLPHTNTLYGRKGIKFELTDASEPTLALVNVISQK